MLTIVKNKHTLTLEVTKRKGGVSDGLSKRLTVVFYKGGMQYDINRIYDDIR